MGARSRVHNEDRRGFLKRAGAAMVGLTALRPMDGAQKQSRVTVGAATGKPEGRAPQQTIRGLMVDAARLPESPDYYRRVIEFCAEWKLNTLQFRLTDDQGSALRFASVPDLVVHPDALTPDEMKTLADFANSRGVGLIPEVESFGHTGFITRSSRYAHLLDADPHGSSEFTGVIPVLTETQELFEKLYREVASIFPSVYLHAGCDEVNWGGSPQSRQALESRTRTQIWVEYLNILRGSAERAGKQLIVWGDYVLHKDPRILAGLDKNIIVMDWNYWDTRATGFRDALLDITKSGHRGIGAPGLISYRWGPRPGSEQLRNIDAFAEAYFGVNDPGSLGVILTNWVPTRYVQGSLWDGCAYAAIAFNDGPAAARITGFRQFVERYYGAVWNETWDEMFELIYAAAPSYGEHGAVSPLGLHLTTPWSSDTQLANVLKKPSSPPQPFTRVRTLLAQVEPSVTKNQSDLQAFALSVECLELLFWRAAAVVELAERKPFDAVASAQMIRTIADRDHALAEKLSRNWDLGRAANSTAKTELIFALQPKDQLLYQWHEASAYTSSLAAHLDRFQQILQASTRP
jgi:hypothetical protein